MNLLEAVTSTQEGWFYSPEFNHAQKVNDGVYCYVSHLIFGYNVQLYIRGNVFMCELEARVDGQTVKGLHTLFQLAEDWLHQYKNGCLDEIRKDIYSVHNPDGVWFDGNKDYWITVK